MTGSTRGDERPSPPVQAEELAAWVEHDLALALHPVDRDAVRATDTARWLVLALLRGGHARDLYNACARLGVLLGEAGASPSLAAATIDGAAGALDHLRVAFDRSRVPAARASLLEGYVAAVREGERLVGLARWEYPDCVVMLEDGDVGVACGYPADDPEALVAWAERTAGRLLKARTRRAILAGKNPARSTLAEALGFVGILTVESGEVRSAEPPTSKPTRSWFRLPWQR